MREFIPFQPEFRQAIPEVIGNKDYWIFRETLERIDQILNQSGIERDLIERILSRSDGGTPSERLSAQRKMTAGYRIRRALRMGIARHLMGVSYREFSCRLADSPVLQQFCLISRIDTVRIPSKSQVQRAENMFPEPVIRDMVVQLNRTAIEENPLGLGKLMSLKDYYVDTTCVKANIHFPIDWVLLRDATKTLMAAIADIRREGIKNRMEPPSEFIRRMNRLSMRMTHTRKRKQGKRLRKQILRLMKKLCHTVTRHAERYLELIRTRWQETGLSKKQAGRIIDRIENILQKLPEAIRQAHERIIGERRVDNRDKILSLYEPDIHVIVRGKASVETEFGNTLLLAEQSYGVIVDWHLYKDQAPQDSRCLKASLERFRCQYGCYPEHATGDRGFHSPGNDRFLSSKQIQNNICPRSVVQLQERLMDPDFCRHQQRRAQTEGRIGIIQNLFLGKPLRSKGFISRNLHVGFGILAHNLWVIARLPKAEDIKAKIPLAA